MGGRLSLHAPSTNRRLTQTTNVSDCKPRKVLRGERGSYRSPQTQGKEDTLIPRLQHRGSESRVCLPKEDRERVTKQMEQITTHRNRQVNHYLHAASKAIIDFLVKEGVGTIIVGKNLLWKQEAGMGKRNNQNFVQIPHAKFIDMLTYKAELVGIQVEVQEESYTSKASFLDLDPIPTYKPNDETEHVFSGKRFGRRNRSYRAKNGKFICADVNGSYNILCKSKPDAFANVNAKGIAAYVVQPLRLAITV